MVPPHFCLKRKRGEKVRLCEEVTYIPNRERVCLTKDQATQIYEEVGKNEPINIQIDSRDNSKVKKKASKRRRH